MYSWLDQAGFANPIKEIEPIPKCSGSKTWAVQQRRKNALNFGEFYFLLVSYSQHISKVLWNLHRNKRFYSEHNSQ
jgi:hypothetical protein